MKTKLLRKNSREKTKKKDTFLSTQPLLSSPSPPFPSLHSVDQFESQQLQTKPDRISRMDLSSISVGKKSSNINTYVRFRPFSNLELQLQENQLGSSCVSFLSQTHVLVGKEKVCFTLDKVYQPSSTQKQIYDEVGHSIIQQIMTGYNGTLFAYGPTGSGKTFTMYGQIGNEQKAGVIPRAVKHIFSKIQTDEDVQKQYAISCCILQLYREILNDLIKTDKTNLKIKQNPVKGIFVEGLTSVHITSEDQLNQLIEQANKNKSVRSTKLNQYSSRSHTLFMLQIVQRNSIGTQITGRLNLVDLAGSEKVSKSGAVGQSLEEAKKINLSLSCLGNVIHALTNNSQHIPYRDSKLTRLLQESIGAGNFKTSLIACMSMHESAQQETISALKFATRVKTIKNHFKLNVTTSSLGLQVIVQILKRQIEDLTRQNGRLKECLQKCQLEFNRLGVDKSLCNQLFTVLEQSNLCDKNRLAEVFQNENLMKSMGIDQTQIQQLKKQVQSVFQSKFQGGSPQLQDSRKIQQELSQPLNSVYSPKTRNAERQKHQKRVLQLQKQLKNAKDLLKQKENSCEELTKTIAEVKRNHIQLQFRLNETINEKRQIEMKLKKQSTARDYQNLQNEVMKQQIKIIADGIAKSQNTITDLLNQKSQILQTRFYQFLKKKLSLSSINIQTYFEESVNFQLKLENVLNLDKADEAIKYERSSRAKMSFVQNYNFETLSKQMTKTLAKQFQVNGKIQNLQSIFKNDPLAKDGLILCLKKQLIQTHILNQQLIRIINALEWKQTIEYGKSQMRAKMVLVQKEILNDLELLLNESTQVHKNMRLKLQQIQFDYSLNSKSHQSRKSANLIVPFKKSDIIKQDCKEDYTSQDKLLFKQHQSKIQKIQPKLKAFGDKIKAFQNQVIPLTYQNALKSINSKTAFCKQIWKQISEGETFKFSADNMQMVKSHNKLRTVQAQNDRLESKVLSLQTELKVQSEKAEHFKKALQLAQADLQTTKKITYQSEQKLKSFLKKESQIWMASLKELQMTKIRSTQGIEAELQKLSNPLANKLMNHPTAHDDLLFLLESIKKLLI